MGGLTAASETLARVAAPLPRASLLSTCSEAALPTGVVRLSSSASISGALAVVTSLVLLMSLTEPVVPVKTTWVAASSVPPCVPGAV